jgi:hypothetical protein
METLMDTLEKGRSDCPDFRPKRVLSCDMRRECAKPVTHLDERGYVYCAEHGAIRKHSMRCRKLSASELRHLESGQPIASYFGGAA